jgi:hypothetical protein
MRIGSFQWWFEDRQTGKITIAQSPNWSLYAVFAGWGIRLLAGSDSVVYEPVGTLVTALWFYWAGDELLRGVNPWRRTLGAIVLIVQVFGLLT